ncbi:MAG: TDT family transporter [Methanobrevibacter sp.]|uniref:TDT family transporter n=1 Tax=Methanobrevibacter sp. TaxID=66852 RepID=UPI0025F37D52|nr:TDT family transporter [Methanobrevibacter sp.]MBQ6098762.1 TDT family transporter [Methanobrevibacter sp.]
MTEARFIKMNLIKNIPIPICGLILALISLGNLLQDIHPFLRYLFGGIGIIFLILIILKIVFYPENIKRDFKNPIIVSSSGTFSMSLMLLSTYIIQFQPGIAYTLWIIGIALHILLMIYFTYHFIICDFDISNVYPSYWIVFVGITMGAITSKVHGIEEIGFLFFIIGFIAMIITLPLVIYRYVRYPDIPDANKPLICIFTALLSILIVGYLNTTTNISIEFVTILYLFACIFYIFAFLKFIEYRNLDFYPSFAAFTFPFVISALATKGTLNKIGFNLILSNILKIEIAIAIIIVLYVLMRYLIFLKKSL